MRFTTAFVTAALAACALAQDSKAATPTVSTSPAQKSIDACLGACKPGDVECQSHCIAVPAPNDAQANATTECAAKCPQGDGSPADTQKFADCINKCIAQNFYVAKTGTPEQTPASGSGSNGNGNSDSQTTVKPGQAQATGTGSGSDSDSDSNSDSNSDSATKTKGANSSKTGSSSASTSTGAAAGLIVPSGAFFGLLAAIFAL